MKVIIDIGHPAHVHYFKNIHSVLNKTGHEVYVIARDKEVTLDLLKAYNINYLSKGKGRKSFFGKVMYYFSSVFLLLKVSNRYKPDLFLSCASPYAAITAWLCNKPHIVLDDTEHSSLTRRLYLPFSTHVLTPKSYELDLGKKHTKINSYVELLALHPNWFKPTAINIHKFLQISKDKKIALLRFVSWAAFHDKGQEGLTITQKKSLILALEENGFRVFISSESILPDEFKSYLLTTPPQLIHDVLQKASICISEGATIATESILLGTPTVYVNTLNCGNQKEQTQKYGLVNLRNGLDLVKEIQPLLSKEAKLEAMKYAKKVVDEKEDFTTYLLSKIHENKFKSSRHFLRSYRLVFFYFLALLLAYVYPFSESLQLNRYEIARLRIDHLLHLIVFIPTPFLLWTCFRQRQTTYKHFLSTLIVSLVIALLFELIHLIISYRSFTFSDMLANVIGVLIGASFLLFIVRRK